ncbi:MAG: DEAD/DEAH box helicase [Bdellovibrionales bacterium]
MSNFSDYGLHPKINSAIEKLGFKEPSKIQEKSIPILQSGQDVAGLAQTGTGKTAAYLIPTLQRLYKTRETEGHEEQHADVKAFENWGPRNQVLILVPTRELVEQVAQNLKDLAPEKDFTYAAIYGGVAYEKQKKNLEDGVDFVIATPGRLIDLYKEKFFDPTQVKSVIFDEADRMFDMGFKDDMKYLLDRIPRDRQFLVFSATLNFDVLTVAYEYGSNPVEIEIDRSLPKTEQVKDEILHVGHNEKPKFLLSVLKENEYEQAIVFSNFVRTVPKVEKFLRENGLKAMGLSSALSQGQRTAVMNKFKSGEINILVATDVAARGLDIENVDLVVNFELPDDSENYVHRIGRTGRAGREGVAVSIVSEKDVAALDRLQSFLGSKLTIGWMDDADLVDDFKPFPYTYDPKGGVRDVRAKRGEDSRPNRGGPKGRDNKRRDHKGGGDRDRKRSDKKFSRDDRKDKKDYKKKDYNAEPMTAAPAKPKSNKKRKPSKRYANYKTVSKGTGKGGLLSKIFGMFK